MTVDKSFLIARASGIAHRLIDADAYKKLCSLESIDELVTALEKLGYGDVLGKYYTKESRSISFARSVFSESDNRWQLLTSNLEPGMKKRFKRLQTLMDIKNLQTFMTMVTDDATETRDPQKLADRILMDLAPGGTIGIRTWTEFAKNPSIDVMIAKSVLMAPQHIPLLNDLKSELSATGEISAKPVVMTALTLAATDRKRNLKGGFRKVDGSDIMNQVLAVFMTRLLLRALLRFTESILMHFEDLKVVLEPWRNVPCFFGTALLDAEKYDDEILGKILDAIESAVPNRLKVGIDDLGAEDDNEYRVLAAELMIERHLAARLRKETWEASGSLAGPVLTLLKVVQEAKNLPWIAFGVKSQLGVDSIMEKVIVL